MTEKKRAKARNVVINFAWCIVATLVQVLALPHLHGWLRIALLVIAVRNVLWFIFALVGVAILAAKSLNEATR